MLRQTRSIRERQKLSTMPVDSTLRRDRLKFGAKIGPPDVHFFDGLMSNLLFPYDHPETLEELQAIIDRGLTENIHLEFKRSDALMNDKARNEVSKDVSAFANSDGGVIIYGIAEEDHKPSSLDGGVDHEKWPKERLEDIIQSNVAPRLEGLRISQITLSAERSAYVVSVPRSERGPHQDRVTWRYFKRHNFKSSPMENYEINDVRNRRVLLPALISVRVDVVRGMLLEVVVENVGDVAASDIRFAIDPPLYWKHGEPPAFGQGIQSLLPNKKLSFLYGTGPSVLGEGSQYVREFAVEATYFHHGAQKRVSDHFAIDLTSLIGTMQEQTDLQIQAERLEKALGKLTKEVETIKDRLSRLSSLADPTGLALSVTSLRNLAHLLGVPSHIEKIDPCACSWQTFQEVLVVSPSTATHLHAFFRKMNAAQPLEEIDGITPDVLARLRLHFVMDATSPAT